MSEDRHDDKELRAQLQEALDEAEETFKVKEDLNEELKNVNDMRLELEEKYETLRAAAREALAAGEIQQLGRCRNSRFACALKTLKEAIGDEQSGG